MLNKTEFTATHVMWNIKFASEFAKEKYLKKKPQN